MAVLQRVKQSIYSKYRLWKIKRQIPDDAYAKFLQTNWIDYSKLKWNERSKSLHVDGLNLELQFDKSWFLLHPFNQIDELLLLQKELGAQYEQRNNELYVQLNNKLTLNIQTNQELLIIREVYLEGIYQFVSRKKFIALDIGMNVGFSSLFFANDPLCEKVFGFEPFVPTYKQAKSNISLNPAVQGKIVPLNYGLSDNNGSLEVNYSPSIRGSMSVDYWPDYAEGMQDVGKEQIQIRDVKEVFDELGLGKPSDKMVIAKIDCEGAEYAILDRLAEVGYLGHIDVIMMEWHLKGVEPLINNMSRYGFECFSFKPFDKYEGKYGFLYAIRK